MFLRLFTLGSKPALSPFLIESGFFSLRSKYNIYDAFAKRPRLLPTNAHFDVSRILKTSKFLFEF